MLLIVRVHVFHKYPHFPRENKPYEAIFLASDGAPADVFPIKWKDIDVLGAADFDSNGQSNQHSPYIFTIISALTFRFAVETSHRKKTSKGVPGTKVLPMEIRPICDVVPLSPSPYKPLCLAWAGKPSTRHALEDSHTARGSDAACLPATTTLMITWQHEADFLS